MQTPIHPPDESATALGAFFCLVWFAVILWWIVAKSRVVADTVAWFRRTPRLVCIAAVASFLALAIHAVIKDGGNAPQGQPRPPLLLQVMEPPPEPAIAPVSVWTNGVALRVESTNAVEITAFRRIGGTEIGDWIETTAPFFAIGTNPVSRCYVGASGSVSFETHRRPQIGRPLPDESAIGRGRPPGGPLDGGNVADRPAVGPYRVYPALCPLRAPLGFVPEARWAQVFVQDEPGSRFWHDALPGGGMVLTWENALVDRLPGRRVSLQVEMRPTGDCVYRYDFHDALDPPATNFVMGAQMGTNGVNALSILGTNTLAATVWNVDGEPVTNGVSIADLLCTNGVLCTPETFEIRWKNTTGLGPEADTDNDGLTDWQEVLVYGTDPQYADTDGDGRDDGIEIEWGDDPFDADENGDGVPDGTTDALWTAQPLWAANSEDAGNVRIALSESIPANATATLVLGTLSIPLREASLWTLHLPEGVTVEGRLFSQGVDSVALSLAPADDSPPLRRGPSDFHPVPRLLDDPLGVFCGRASEGTFRLAVPKVLICNLDGAAAESEIVHDFQGHRDYTVRFEPEDWGLSLDDCHLDGFENIGNGVIRLSVGGDAYDTAIGTVELWTFLLDYGIVSDSISLTRCSMPADEPYPVSLAVDIGVADTNVFKAILPRYSTNPPGRPMMSCRLRRLGWTEHVPTFHISGPKLKFGPDAQDSITATLTGTNSFDFLISGEIASEAMDDAVITVRRDGPTGPICATGTVTIVWVDPITMRMGTNETFSADNASPIKPQPPYLGLHAMTFTDKFAPTVGHVVEIKGAVHPASCPSVFEFRRHNIGAFVSGKDTNEVMTIAQNEPYIPTWSTQSVDRIWSEMDDLDPSPNGFIYDVDTPGLAYLDFKGLPYGTWMFARYNFIQNVVVDGVRCSNDFNWHARMTLKKGSGSNTNGIFKATRPGHADDNSVGTGFTTIGLD